jgi:hypothetical protein
MLTQPTTPRAMPTIPPRTVELYAMSPKSNVAPVTISNDVAELQVIGKSKKSLKKSARKQVSRPNKQAIHA